MLRLIPAFLALIFCVSAISTKVWAQAPQPSSPAQGAASADAIREWFEAQWCNGVACLPSGTGHFKVRYEEYPTLSREEVEARWAEIKDKPDHPERPSIQKQLAMYRTGPEVADYEFWFSGSRWRFNNTTFDAGAKGEGPSFFLDFGWSPEATWSMGPDALHVADPDRLPDEHADWFRPPSLARNMVAQWMLALLHGGAGNPGTGDLNITSIEPVANGRWRIVVARSDTSRQTYTLNWDSDRGRMIDKLTEHLEDDGSWRPTGRLVLSDEVVETPIGMAYRSAEALNGDGRTLRRYQLLGADMPSESEVEALVRVPDAREPDPIRGQPTFRNIYDYVPGHARVSLLSEGQVVRSAPLRGVPNSGLPIRYLGWAIAAVLAACLVGFQLRRYLHK